MKPKSIAIIGGGPGGLMTAHLLQQRSHVPLAITIYEATDRLGGKVMTRTFTNGVKYEAGAAELYDYSFTGEDPLRELVAELGLPTQPISGETVILDGHILKTYGDIRRAFGNETVKALKRFNRKAENAISPAEYYESDWKVDNEDPLSNCSFRALLNKISDANARRYVEVAVHSDVAAEPHQTSASYGLQNWLMNEDGYMELYAITGGNGRLVDELVKRMKAEVRFNHRVAAVRLKNGKYEIESRNAKGTRRDAFEYVVAALPNNWLPAIRWEGEALAKAMERHHAHYDHPAHYLRVSVLFRKPFWRDRIAEDYFMVDSFGGACIYDETFRGEPHENGVLAWLLGGGAAATMSNQTDDQLLQAVFDSLPADLAAEAREHFLEARVHRWINAVNALPGGRPIHNPELRHRPEPLENPKFFTAGDYLFDSTLNGVLDSAEWVAESVLEQIRKTEIAPMLASMG
jgi:monoamine oxidase